MPISAITRNAYTRSPRFRPPALLSYEHMFPPTQKPTLAQRTLGALRLARSFLLLEDDYDVDWEVDQDELHRSIHPHRTPLRGRAGVERPAHRRAGQPSPRSHVCLAPVSRATQTRAGTQARRERQGRVPRAPGAAPGARPFARER
jgi:hypothetical protein